MFFLVCVQRKRSTSCTDDNDDNDDENYYTQPMHTAWRRAQDR